MSILFLVISLIDLYEKLLLLYVVIHVLTVIQVLNSRNFIVKKIEIALLWLFNKPLHFIRKKLPHVAINIDFSPLILLLTLQITKYILRLLI